MPPISPATQHKLTLNKYDKEAKLRALIKETSDAFLTANAHVRRIKATQKALESAAKSREAIETMETGFNYGVETITDVLKAQEEEFKARRDLAKAKYGYVKNRIRFLQAIGTISEENLEEVNGWLQASSPETSNSHGNTKHKAATGLLEGSK